MAATLRLRAERCAGPWLTKAIAPDSIGSEEGAPASQSVSAASIRVMSSPLECNACFGQVLVAVHRLEDRPRLPHQHGRRGSVLFLLQPVRGGSMAERTIMVCDVCGKPAAASV